MIEWYTYGKLIKAKQEGGAYVFWKKSKKKLIEKAAELFNRHYKNCASMWKHDKETVNMKFYLENLEKLA